MRPDERQSIGDARAPRNAARRGGSEGFRPAELLLFFLATLAVMIFCVCAGSVRLPVGETLKTIWNAALCKSLPDSTNVSIILHVRLPRVLCVALTGAALDEALSA